MPRCRITLEIGTHSPWISRLLSELGHEVIVANARKVRLIGESRKKDDRLDAQTLARLARIDPQLLCPVKHRSAQAQADLMMIRARAGLVRARTGLVNAARGLAKSYGERLRGRNVRNMNPEKAERLSPELQRALEPLLSAIQELNERICEYNDRIEALAQQSFPQVALLKQIKGVGTLIALTFLLTLEDPHRFGKSRDVGCYLGLQPGRRNSGQSEPQMHISKEGDPYLRTLLVQGAQHILGPFGVDCDLQRWGLKLPERGGRNGKKLVVAQVLPSELRDRRSEGHGAENCTAVRDAHSSSSAKSSPVPRKDCGPCTLMIELFASSISNSDSRMCRISNGGTSCFRVRHPISFACLSVGPM